jgi:hypothetical protein
MQTLVRVRVQAHGGKYLGPAVAGGPPLLTLSWPGQAPFGPCIFPIGSSGVVVSASERPANASPYPITVQPSTVPNDYTPGTYYLMPPASGPDSYLIVALDLPDGVATEVTFGVQAFSTAPVSGSTSAIVTGGVNQIDEPGVVVLVPGLRITAVVATSGSSSTKITANVAMMCGCAITPNDALPAEPYWPAYEFSVGARVQGYGKLVALACTGTSTFEATLPFPVPIGTLVSIIAAQTSIQNSNSMDTAVVATPSST